MQTIKETLAAAFELRRAWLAAGCATLINATDLLVIGVVLRLTEAGSLSAEDPLAADFTSTLGMVTAFRDVRVNDGDHSGKPKLHLCDSRRKAPSSSEHDCILLYGFETGFGSDHALHLAAPGEMMLPLAFCAPALWRSRMALYHAPAGSGQGIASALYRYFNDDVFDPLRLFEEVESLKGRSRVRLPEGDYVQTLENEVSSLRVKVRSLEQSGLVRHHLLATAAAARARAER